MINLRVKAALSKVTECDFPEMPENNGEVPPFMVMLQGDAGITNELTADVSKLVLPDAVDKGDICGPLKIVFALWNNSNSQAGKFVQSQKTASIPVHIECEAGDVKLEATYGSSDVPSIEVGAKNPFGAGSSVKVDYGSCYMPKTMACLYCGFDDGKVGIEDSTWNAWTTIQVCYTITPSQKHA